MGSKAHDRFSLVRPSLLSQELDPAIAHNEFGRRKLEPGWLSDGEYLNELVMDDVRKEIGAMLVKFIEVRRPTLGHLVRKRTAFGFPHPLLTDDAAILMREHNARLLCHVATKSALDEDPNVGSVLEPEALARLVCEPNTTITDRIALYAEERLIQRYGQKLMKLLD